ncbi:MAG: DUF5998 family protein [Propionicimonas sp.]|uniref:DUF5998 family protein n=1 Tax=Propionicimonas sp. TaxID=1955623 RepID=UPI002B212FDF|nr:DUF5998 family protein [Propionicimonas sp.]MEA4943663.1 DUF5998 family protein [Propionicimonas sp.]
MPNRHGPALPAALTDEIRDCGYFPELIADAIARARGPEQVEGYLVHHEATFNRDEIQRHLSVLLLTPTRLLVGHTDENEAPGEPVQALTTTESVPLGRVGSVALSQVVSNPESYGTRRAKVVEAWLTIGWGTMRRIDLLPAQCDDPTCEADHGYTGDLANDDLTVRISAAADGEAKVNQLIEFSTQLQLATGITR